MHTSIAPKIYASNFLAFLEKAFYYAQGHKLSSTQLYIRFIALHLERFLEGDVNKLLVNLPGRHLKTFICSVCLPAFMLGLDPTLKFLIVSYDESIAEDIVRQIRDIMASSWYKSAFGTRLDPKHSKKYDFKVMGGGRVRAAAVRRVTGKGGDIIIFDDPHNVSDWNKETAKYKVIEAFEYLVSRRDGGDLSRMLVVAHRVAEDDLSAHILERGDEFKHICLPLYAPKDMFFDLGNTTWHLAKGEALRPNAYPPHTIKSLRQNHQGTPFWLYYQQGFGSKKDGSLIEVSHFPFVSGVDRSERDATGTRVVLSVDPAQKTESISRNVIHVYAVLGKQYTLLEAFAEKCSSGELERAVRRLAGKYHASLIIVEDTARGSDLSDELVDMRIPIIRVNPRGTKASRLRKCLPIIQAKRVRIKKNRADAEAAMDEVLAYPNSAYTDHVDALTYFLIEAMKFGPDTWSAMRPPALARAIVATALASNAMRLRPTEGVAMVRAKSIYGAAELPDFSNGRQDNRTSFTGRSPYAAEDSVEPIFSWDGERMVRIN